MDSKFPCMGKHYIWGYFSVFTFFTSSNAVRMALQGFSYNIASISLQCMIPVSHRSYATSSWI